MTTMFIKHKDSGLVAEVRGVEHVPGRPEWSNIYDKSRITYTLRTDAFRIMTDSEIAAFKAKNGTR